jgi:RNA recognition motif-containing protein
MKIYVGNLSWNLKDDDLANLLMPYGDVVSAAVVIDNFTNRSKGFGFVEMGNADEAVQAINGLNGAEVEGRNIVVNESTPNPGGNNKPSGGGGFRKRS